MDLAENERQLFVIDCAPITWGTLKNTQLSLDTVINRWLVYCRLVRSQKRR